MKKILILILLISAVVLGISLRGLPGNPKAAELTRPSWKENGPFELSPERGRYALLYSFVENNSFFFELPLARFAAPDLGYSNGNYVSLFAPGVSFATIPGYLVGRLLGGAQVGAVATISLFALANSALVYLIARRLCKSNAASTISSVVFLFATPAFTYAVTLYQHHISLFLILSALYVLLRWKTFWSLLLIWLLVAASVPVDYPNLVLMLPLAFVASGRIVYAKFNKKGLTLSLSLINALTPIVMVLPLLFYVWFSMNSYGKPLQLSGTIDSISAIGTDGKPMDSNLIIDQRVSETLGTGVQDKSAAGFFQTRNLLNGFYIHTLSPDRGILVFTPIVLFGIVGFFVLFKNKQTELSIIASIIGFNFVLYSLWGDPWGGWAFGSRYLIPSYALLIILASAALAKYHSKKIFLLLFFLTASYSIAVNTLGAITSSANPPQVQVLALEKQTGNQEKYTYERNIDFLLDTGTKSFVYNFFLRGLVTPVAFYWAIVGALILLLGLITASFNKVKLWKD